MGIGRKTAGWWESTDRPLRHMPGGLAKLLLALLAALMVWSAYAASQIEAGDPVAAAGTTEASPGSATDKSGDLALYDRISQRVASGENYYAAAMDEQRAANYPTRPFVTVRQPTLAMVHSVIGTSGARWLAMGLLGAGILAFLYRFRSGILPIERAGAGILLLFGGAAVMAPEAGLIHELIAGLLLTLALATYSPRNWWLSLLFAALAIAVRELALPFVLLWLAFAVFQRRWSEALSVAALLTLFAAGMALHYHAVEAYRLAGDPASQGWNALAGMGLPLFALSKLTALLILPTWLAGFLALLPLIGWLGLGGRLGLFASLWFAGFFLAMALFARPENFYWVQLVLPAYLAGLALAPRAIADLYEASRA